MGRFDFNSLMKVPLSDRLMKPMEETKPSSSELSIGEIYRDNPNGKGSNIPYIVTPAERPGSCIGCDFYIDKVCHRNKKFHCTAYSRSDRTWVILKKANVSTK